MKQLGAMLTQAVGMFQKFLSAIAKVISVPADVFHCLAVAAANGVADFFSTLGRQKQREPCADSNTSEQNTKVPQSCLIVMSTHDFSPQETLNIFRVSASVQLCSEGKPSHAQKSPCLGG
jgi:hypothetical protein